MGWMFFVYLVVVVAAFAVMLKIKGTKQVQPWHTPVTILCFLVILVCGFEMLKTSGVLREFGFDFGFNENRLSADVQIYASQGDVVASVLEKHNLKQARILLIHTVGFEDTREYQALVERLQANGFSNVVADTPSGSQTGKSREGAQRLSAAQMTPQMLNRAASRHSDCAVVISTVGLPVFGAEKCDCISKKYSAKSQQWVIFEPAGNRMIVQRGVSGGNVIAACLFNDSPEGETDSLPDEPAEIFALRYKLISK